MKVIFLDRDGVINRSPGGTDYVTDWAEFRFLPKVKSAIKSLTDAGYKIFVVSNQSGVSKGIYSRQRLDEITRKMIKELDNAGGRISVVYYCIHRDEDNCSCRKPKPGLFKQAIKEHKIAKYVLRQNFFIGDSIRDIQAGQAAGCRTFLVFSGRETPGDKADWPAQPDFTAADLSEAVGLILRQNDEQ